MYHIILDWNETVNIKTTIVTVYMFRMDYRNTFDISRTFVGNEFLITQM